ncbi:hypothetical protein VE01_09951 [Pseudogymnoascus verrucosus]|uniref:Glutamine repeat protein-1 n=1 Tax=Pseudogymnoascus verrucosus TaxID=342668 RepID=A0A1B8G852_9PEZI|nr:uncharacterized protein VE01_09951 [Pseudogymnoascus verrucosus]OBT92005.1 hypothetical protein VE01_09951 [Pseudogymnoascus verrucosus]
MYAPQYPFAPGPNAPPPPQQQQPGYIQNPAAQQQQMMYNPQQQGQQFGMPMGGVPQQPPYGPGMNGPNMVPGPNAVMMQNGGAGMPHMGPGNNGIASYQTPYNNSPYGMQGGPPSSGPQQQAFLPAGANAAQSGFVQPAPQQRMHTPQQHQQQQMGTPQRGSSYGPVPGQHTTPPHTQAPSQFMPPQPGTPQMAMPMQQQQGLAQQGQQAQQPVQQPQSAGQTPVTPSFPTSAGGMATPLSPGSEVREKDRVSLLLDINRVLLMEVMRLQAVQAEAKAKVESDDKKDDKEDGAEGAKDKEKKDDKAKEKPKIDPVTGKEFVECMRRIQYNLAYLAAIADRSHKPSSQIPPHPAVISAPSLTPLPKPATSSPTSPNGAVKSTDGAADAEVEDRAETLKKQYKRLQELFPGVDPKKEPTVQPAQAAQKQQQQQQQQQPGPSAPQKAQMAAQMQAQLAQMSQAQKMEFMQRKGMQQMAQQQPNAQQQQQLQRMRQQQQQMQQQQPGWRPGQPGGPQQGGPQRMGPGMQQGGGMDMSGMGMGSPSVQGMQQPGQQ